MACQVPQWGMALENVGSAWSYWNLVCLGVYLLSVLPKRGGGTWTGNGGI